MIIHIPHTSSFIPEVERPSYVLSDEKLQAEILAMTDSFTDELFAAGDDHTIRVVYSVSRLVVDPERFADDEQEPMAEIGMGVIYTRTSTGDILRTPPDDTGRRLIAEYYAPHHQALTEAVQKELNSLGRSLIIDCHSFPSKPLPYEFDQNSDRPDICLGTDEYHTPRLLAETAFSLFEDCGYRVAFDQPFSGSIVPAAFYRKNSNVHSVMIEVNRKLYMNEKTGSKIAEFKKLQEHMSSVLTNISDAGRDL